MIEHRQNSIPYRETAPAAGGFVTPLLLVAYLVAKPFYLFSSGGAQVADVIVVVLFLLAAFSRQTIGREMSPILWMCVLFATYSLFVNGIWALLLNDLSMIMTPVYYFFNAAIVYIIFSCYGRIGTSLFKAILAGVVISTGIQMVLSVWIIDPGTERQALFFNNENQLGYWSLLSATIFCILARHLKLKLLFQLPVLLVAFYMLTLSLSKGAIIAALLLLAIHISKNVWQFLLVAVMGVIATFFIGDVLLSDQVVDRLMNIGHDSDDSLSGRGYDRIWLYPQYLLFGAGEKGLERFSETDIELHSTLGTVLFGYGVIGVYLLGLLLWRLLRLAGWREFLYLVPTFAYGVAHQGLRFSLFWFLFATIAIVGATVAAGGPETSKVDSQNKRLPTRYPENVMTRQFNK